MKKAIYEWFIKHKIKILMIIIFILIFFALNRLLVFISKKGNNKSEVQMGENIETNTSQIYNSVALESTESVTMGEDMNNYQTQLVGTIDQFISYCNEQKIEEAYNLLSDDCKKELYPTINNFINTYYGKVFNGKKKNVSIENWNSNIYKVTIDEDALSTGNYTQDNSIQDYITIIVDDNKNAKLNINSYIGREKLDKIGSNKNVEITALERNTYMDYQTITFNIKNNTNSDILLDDLLSTDTMYLTDKNGMNYTSYSNEISSAELVVFANQSRDITIKYASKYASDKTIESVVFSKVAFNYNADTAKEYGRITIYL